MHSMYFILWRIFFNNPIENKITKVSFAIWIACGGDLVEALGRYREEDQKGVWCLD